VADRHFSDTALCYLLFCDLGRRKNIPGWYFDVRQESEL